jgi:hypothetical protein
MTILVPLNFSESKEFIDTKNFFIGQAWTKLWHSAFVTPGDLVTRGFRFLNSLNLCEVILWILLFYCGAIAMSAKLKLVKYVLCTYVSYL